MRNIEHVAVAVTFAAACLFAACGGAAAGVQPDDMSAEAHARHATTEEAAADRHEAEYDPSAIETREVGGAVAARNEGGGAVRTVNPTAVHQQEAATHHDHAEQHAAAAQALRAYEAAECRAFPAEARAACPLLSDVTGVTDIAGGVRITFAPGAPVDPLIARMRCHFAYARTRAYEGMQSCPLYIRGVDVRAGAGHSIELFGADPAIVQAIREEARMTTNVTPR